MRERVNVNVSSWFVGVLAGLSVWSLGSFALAQAPQAPKHSSFAEELMREIDRARRQVETLYVLRLSEALALNTEQSGQAAAVIRKAQEARRGLLEERRQMLQELNTLLSTGARAERIKPKLSQWVENEVRLGRWRQGLFQDLSRILSAEQQGRFVLFDENFNNEIRNAVMELRTGGSQGTKE
jgi:hypothetical protein